MQTSESETGDGARNLCFSSLSGDSRAGSGLGEELWHLFLALCVLGWGTLLLWVLVSTCVDEGGVQQSGAAILHRVPWHTAHLSQHCSPVRLNRPRTSLSPPPMPTGSVVLPGGWGWH